VPLAVSVGRNRVVSGHRTVSSNSGGSGSLRGGIGICTVVTPYTGDQGVDNGLSEAIVQGEVGLQEPVIRRAEEQVEDDVRVGIS
jgi:hypothetical protein